MLFKLCKTVYRHIQIHYHYFSLALLNHNQCWSLYSKQVTDYTLLSTFHLSKMNGNKLSHTYKLGISTIGYSSAHNSNDCLNEDTYTIFPLVCTYVMCQEHKEKLKTNSKRL